ncbi:MAG: DNA polymerase III subunit beta [Magnetococcales bacterium]|nr:DNA polymerase III subunit beta [Magnetococcales bacterium]
MEFQIDREPFLKALTRLQSVVERRNTKPILGYALLQADGDTLHVSGTDQEVSLRSSCPARVTVPGAMAVAAKKLFEIVRELPDQELSLSQTGDARLLLTCGRARFNLAWLPAEQFPELPEASDDFHVTLDGPILSEMFAKTSFAISNDDTRYTLNGVHLQIGLHPVIDPENPIPAEGEEREMRNMVRMVATDTHRMAMIERALSTTLEEGIGVIIPKKGVMEAQKMVDETDDPVDLVVTADFIQFSRPDISLISKLVDGRFPAFERVIPRSNNRMLSVSRQELHSVIKRMAVLSHEKSRGIGFKLSNNHLEISTDNPEQEIGEEEMSVVYTSEPFQIGFNARYLQDVIAAMDGEATRFLMLGEKTPVLVTDPDQDHYLFVIMPMRV